MKKNNITELVFILDRSGSMYGLESDTIGGFNSLIDKQKMTEGKCYVSTVLFDDECKVLHDRVKLENVKPMTHYDYQVGGCTALIDAIGEAIKHIVNITNMLAQRMYQQKQCSLSQPTVWKTLATNSVLMK